MNSTHFLLFLLLLFSVFLRVGFFLILVLVVFPAVYVLYIFVATNLTVCFCWWLRNVIHTTHKHHCLYVNILYIFPILFLYIGIPHIFKHTTTIPSIIYTSLILYCICVVGLYIYRILHPIWDKPHHYTTNTNLRPAMQPASHTAAIHHIP